MDIAKWYDYKTHEWKERVDPSACSYVYRRFDDYGCAIDSPTPFNLPPSGETEQLKIPLCSDIQGFKVGEYVYTPDDGSFTIREIMGEWTPAPWGVYYHLNDLEEEWEPTVGNPAAVDIDGQVKIIIINAEGHDFCLDTDGNEYKLNTLENPRKFNV